MPVSRPIPDVAYSTSAFVEKMLEEGRAAWRDVDVDAPTASAHVERLEKQGGGVLEECAFPEDLYLTIACAAGDDKAIRAFERDVLPGALASVGAWLSPSLTADDLKQAVRAKLFVRDGASPTKIEQFTGRGPLAKWVRVVAVRVAISAARGGRDTTTSEDDVLLDLTAPGETPEMQHLRERYREDFKRAFHDALAALDVEDRNLLRLHLVQNVSIDDLAPVLQIHRATVARRLVRARERIAEHTESLLLERLKVTHSEVVSIIKLVLSQMDVSIVRALGVQND